MIVPLTQGFFNTLRMEVAGKGVKVHMVCPGPVQTPYAKRQFGAVLGKVYTHTTTYSTLSAVEPLWSNLMVVDVFLCLCRDLISQWMLGRRTALE